jgi:hypothetical protein
MIKIKEINKEKMSKTCAGEKTSSLNKQFQEIGTSKYGKLKLDPYFSPSMGIN